MCGRFNTHDLNTVLLRLFGLTDLPPHLPPGRYNTAPTQTVIAVRARQNPGYGEGPHHGPDASSRGIRLADAFRWGLVPRWAKDPGIGARMINARCETVAEKPSFREAIKKRRCLVPMMGYYEWQGDRKARQPFYVHMEDQRPFAVAGIWEHWASPDGELETVSLLTQDATERMARLHHRMPVMVPQARFDEWLDPTQRDPRQLISFYAQLPPDGLTWRAVNPVVNNTRNEGPECIEPFDTSSATDQHES